MKLVVFDLDQTLVDFIPVHDEVTRRVFRNAFGVEARLTDIDFAGKSLTENMIELGKIKGIPERRVRLVVDRLLREYEKLFADSMPGEPARHILPGAVELLEALARTDNVVALYTGSSRGIVDTVLRATGLGKFFRFALYGTEAASRWEMVKEATGMARSLAGREFRGKEVVVIGDSVRDIEAGKRNGALTIAVATGFHSEEQLRRAGPDFLFHDLVDRDRVLEALGSPE